MCKRGFKNTYNIVSGTVLQIFSIAGLIASAIALDDVLNNVPDALLQNLDRMVEDITGLNYTSMIFNSLSGAGLGVAVSVVVIIYEIIPIVLRFLNIGLINYKIKIFLGIVSYNACL